MVMPEYTQKIYAKLDYQMGVSKQHYKEYTYSLYDDGEVIGRFNTIKQPSELTTRSTHLQDFIKTLLDKDIGFTDDDGDLIKYSKEQVTEKIIKVLGFLQADVSSYYQNKDRIEEDNETKQKEALINKLESRKDEFYNLLEKYDVSLTDFLYLISEWLNGGESSNTMIGFICHLSTYLGINPVWFFVLGKAGEGKSVIDESAQKLIPPEALMNGRMSESALHRKSLIEGEDYLDGKIMTMGDMGGDYDMEKWEGTLDRYKELTTEGVTEVEKTGEGVDPKTGERVVIPFKVYGYCSVSMTSVHSEKLSDQLLSRGINVTPQATDAQVKMFARFNKGKYKRLRLKIMDEMLGLFHDYLRYIYQVHRDVEVINPYWDSLSEWFSSSTYFKRNLSIYPSLVEAWTLLNYEFREVVHAKDGTEYLVSTKEDNCLIAELFDPGYGLTQNAIQVFNKIVDYYVPKDVVITPEYIKIYESEVEAAYDEFTENTADIKKYNYIFSVSVIKNKCSKSKALRGLPYGEIIKHLTDMGLLEVVGKLNRGNNNVYCLHRLEPIEPMKINFDDSVIGEYVRDMCDVYDVGGHTLLEIVKNENRNNGSPCSIPGLELPPWVNPSTSKVPRGASKGSKVPIKENKNTSEYLEKMEAK